jgi:hypothetical protein
LTTVFGDRKFADQARVISPGYTIGDLVLALERCLATTYDELEKDAEMLAALCYTARSS